MISPPLPAPVILCVYNRPDNTRRVIEVLRLAKPRRMLIIADGPANGKAADAEHCTEVLQVIQGIDWETKIDFNVSPINLGCRKRIQTGLSWAFNLVDEAIILEDDCLPDPTFLPFCTQLLQKYRDEKTVGLIGGANFQFGRNSVAESYFFSRYPLLWGWAAWRRTWDIYDPDLELWDGERDALLLSELLADPLAEAYWKRILDQVKSGFDTWDYSLVFSCWRANLLAIQPSMNLVENTGFGGRATHTHAATSVFANISTHEMPFPLIHPGRIERNVACDAWTEQVAFSGTARKRFEIAQKLSRLRLGPST